MKYIFILILLVTNMYGGLGGTHTRGEINPAYTRVVASGNVVANGVNKITITVNMYDYEHVKIINAQVSAADMNANHISPLNNDNNGSYSFSVVSVSPGEITYQIYATAVDKKNVAHSDNQHFVTIEFLEQEVVDMNVTVVPNKVVANGVAMSTITTILKDKDGRTIGPYKTVTYEESGLIADASEMITNYNDHSYSFTTKSYHAGTSNYTVKVDNKETNVTVAFIPDNPSDIEALAFPTMVTANGVSFSTITITVKDDNGNVITDANIGYEESGLIADASEITNNGDGTYTFTTKSYESGESNYTITIDGENTNNIVTIRFYNLTPVYKELTPAMLNLSGFTNHRAGSNVDVSHYFELPENSIVITYSSVDVRRTNTGHTTFTLAGGEDQYGDWRINYNTSRKIKISHGGALGGRGKDILVSSDGRQYQFNGVSDYRLKYSEPRYGYYVIYNPKKKKVFSSRSFEWTAKTFETSYSFILKTTARSGYHKGSDYKIFVDISHQ